MVRKLFALLAIAFLPAVALAQPEAGKWEFTLSGTGASSDDFDDTALNANFSLGNFLTKEIELGLRQGLSWIDVEDAGDAFAGSTTVFIDYHFDLGKWQPFIGANLGYLYGDDVDDSWYGGPEGGVKFFVNNTTFIYATVQYEWLFDADDDDGRWMYGLGIGFLFGK